MAGYDMPQALWYEKYIRSMGTHEEKVQGLRYLFACLIPGTSKSSKLYTVVTQEWNLNIVYVPSEQKKNERNLNKWLSS